MHTGAHGNADLVAHFFRRAFGLIREGGCFGLIATNTIGQGDTRETGLCTIIAAGGAIANAVKRLSWPGEAAVVVSVVHVSKGDILSPILDGRPVERISAYLVEGDLDGSPARLIANRRVCFQGTNVVGMGFTFDDDNASKGICASLANMNTIISSRPACADRIKPFIGGEEINNDPEQRHRRFVIQFDDLPLNTVEDSYPDLLDLVTQYVKPQRMLDKRDQRRINWWKHGERQSGLYNAIGTRQQVIAISIVSPQFGLAILPSPMVYAHSLAIFCYDRSSSFATLQSRVHEVWVRFFASSMKDDLRYTPSDCFETFPLPPGYAT